MAWRAELVAALGGEADLSPQRRKLVELAARAALLVDHVDAYLFEQRTLVNRRSRSIVPVLVQRQALADHLARLLDKLGLDRVPLKLPALEAYVQDKYGKATEAGADRPQRPTCPSVGGSDDAADLDTQASRQSPDSEQSSTSGDGAC